MTDLPQVSESLFAVPSLAQLQPAARFTHPPRILLLYGSLRERSFSRLLSEEAARLLIAMGCETRTFNPDGLTSQTVHRTPIPRCRSCANWPPGVKAWCGHRPSATGP